MTRCSLIFILVFSAAVDALAAWRATTLVETGTAVPDMASAQITELGEVYPRRDSDEIVFWAKVGDARPQWALLSWRAGKLRTIATEQNTQARTAGESDVVRLRRFANGTYMASEVVNGKLLYLVTYPYPFQNPQRPVIYGWNGQQLRKLLESGSSLKIDGTPYTIGWLFPFPETSDDGALFLIVTLDRPQKRRALIALDGTEPGIVLATDNMLPHASGRRVTSIGCDSNYAFLPALTVAACVSTRTPEERLPRQEVVSVNATGGRTIIRADEPYPGDPTGRVAEIRFVAAGGPDAALLLIRKSGSGSMRPFVAVACTLRPIALDVDGSHPPEATKAFFPFRDQASALVQTKTLRSGAVPGEVFGRTDYFWCDQVCTRLTSPTTLIDETSTVRRAPKGFGTYIITGRRAAIGLWTQPRPETIAIWVFDAGAPAKGLQAPETVVTTASGQSVSVAQIDTGRSSGELIGATKSAISIIRNE